MSTYPAPTSEGNSAERIARLEMENALIIHWIVEVSNFLEDPMVSQAVKLIYSSINEPVPDDVLEAFVEALRDEDDKYYINYCLLPECQTATAYCRSFVTACLSSIRH